MIKKVVGLYYSPTGGTKRMTEMLAASLVGLLKDCSTEDIILECHDLESGIERSLYLDEDCIAVIGMPVYMGKLPLPAAMALSHVKTSGAMTLAAVSYGGPSYGNALYELQRCAEAAAFRIVGIGAFMINYRIPGVRQDRGPVIDSAAMSDFVNAAAGKIARLNGCEIDGLRIKPAPIEAPGRMPVHLVSRVSPAAAATAQRMISSICFRRRSSEWYL